MNFKTKRLHEMVTVMVAVVMNWDICFQN